MVSDSTLRVGTYHNIFLFLSSSSPASFSNLSIFASSSKTHPQSPLQIYLANKTFGYGASPGIALGTKILFSEQSPNPFKDLEEKLAAIDLKEECDKRVSTVEPHNFSVAFNFKDQPVLPWRVGEGWRGTRNLAEKCGTVSCAFQSALPTERESAAESRLVGQAH